MNYISITGALGRDPECKVSKGGTQITAFSVAVNSGWGDKKRTDWLEIITFGKTADIMGNSLHKGSKVLVQGRVQVDKWEKDGQKHSKYVVVADNVEFLDSKKEASPFDSMGEGIDF